MPNFNWALQYCVTVNALISACHSERERKRQRRSQYIDCHIIILMARIVEYLPPYTCAPPRLIVMHSVSPCWLFFIYLFSSKKQYKVKENDCVYWSVLVNLDLSIIYYRSCRHSWNISNFIWYVLLKSIC